MNYRKFTKYSNLLLSPLKVKNVFGDKLRVITIWNCDFKWGVLLFSKTML